MLICIWQRQLLPVVQEQSWCDPHVLPPHSGPFQHSHFDHEVAPVPYQRPIAVELKHGLYSWFQLGNWFLTFYIIINLVGDSLRNPNDDCWSGTVFDVDHGGWFSDHDFLGDRKSVTLHGIFNVLISLCLKQSSKFYNLISIRKGLNPGCYYSWVLGVIYLATLGLQIILALGNRPKSVPVVNNAICVPN